jgi:outer membrane protein OmpA-like peptidoglycan-associated protein
MTADLMEAVSGHISPDLVQKAAEASGETPQGTRAALLGAVPTLFAGLAQGASSPSGATGVFALVTRAAMKPKEAGGQALLGNVFGLHAEAVTDALANHAGVRPASAAGILALIGPLALGAVGKESASRGLSGGGLAQMLFSHKKAILDNPNTPKGLGGALGLGSLAELGGPAAAVSGPTASAVETAPPAAPKPPAAARAKERVREVREKIPVPKRASNWPIMLLPALLLGVLALWGLSNMFRGRPQMPEVSGESPTLRQGTGVQERQGPPSERVPGGAPSSSVPQVTAPPVDPSQMAAPEVAHPESTLPDPKLNFDVASAELTPASKAGVEGLAIFLQSNPEVAIRVEGFADSTGDTAANEALSDSRAKAVKSALVAQGVDASRIETSGMGNSHPVAPNDTGDDRAQNRRAQVTRVR